MTNNEPLNREKLLKLAFLKLAEQYPENELTEDELLKLAFFKFAGPKKKEERRAKQKANTKARARSRVMRENGIGAHQGRVTVAPSTANGPNMGGLPELRKAFYLDDDKQPASTSDTHRITRNGKTRTLSRKGPIQEITLRAGKEAPYNHMEGTITRNGIKSNFKVNQADNITGGRLPENLLPKHLRNLSPGFGYHGSLLTRNGKQIYSPVYNTAAREFVPLSIESPAKSQIRSLIRLSSENPSSGLVYMNDELGIDPLKRPMKKRTLKSGPSGGKPSFSKIPKMNPSTLADNITKAVAQQSGAKGPGFWERFGKRVSESGQKGWNATKQFGKGIGAKGFAAGKFLGRNKGKAALVAAVLAALHENHGKNTARRELGASNAKIDRLMNRGFFDRLFNRDV